METSLWNQARHPSRYAFRYFTDASPQSTKTNYCCSATDHSQVAYSYTAVRLSMTDDQPADVTSDVQMFGIVYILAGIGLVASLLSYLVGMLLAKQEKLILEALQEQQVEVNAAEMQVKLEIQDDKVSLCNL
jgi:hypothetical protein